MTVSADEPNLVEVFTSIFEKMMFPDFTTPSMEGTSREYEIEVYIEGLDITQIDAKSLSKEEHEQWGVYVPRGSNNVSDGRIRARRTTCYRRESQDDGSSLWIVDSGNHRMTIKTDHPEKGDLESEVLVEAVTFDQFSRMSDQGMIKTRYRIPFYLEDISLVAEVDVFTNDVGASIPWVKIDIEYPEGVDWSTHPLKVDNLPDVLRPGEGKAVHILTPEDPKDTDVYRAAKKIYDEYFLKPNKHLSD